MKILKTFFVLLLSFSIYGCSNKNFTQRNTAFVVFKTPSFKYADMSFIYSNDEYMKIDMYSSGASVMSLSIDSETVCMSMLECLDKKDFNSKVLSEHYEVDFIENIFKGQPILNKQNMNVSTLGFKQNVTSDSKYDIEYSVLNNKIKFRDRINKILIKIKRIP